VTRNTNCWEATGGHCNTTFLPDMKRKELQFVTSDFKSCKGRDDRRKLLFERGNLAATKVVSLKLYFCELVATSRKVAVSIPDAVIRFFSWPNPSSHMMTLVSTQPLTEMGTRNLPVGKGCQRVRLTILPPSVSRLSRENVRASTSLNPMGLQVLLQA
jgi:hypothetical protein